MSQAGLLNPTEIDPQIPTQFDTDSGSAIPIANVLNILGGPGITTSGAGNTVTISQTNGPAISQIALQTGTTPIVPTVGGLIGFTGAVVAAGTNPVRTDGTGVNSMALEVQISQALAATDATKIGLSNFDSSSFNVDANGFVTLKGGGIAIDSFLPDTGTSPVFPNGSGQVSLLGLSGSKTVGGTNTLTIKSPPYSNQGSSTSVTLNSGSFATAAITLTTPVTLGLADGELLEFVGTNGVIVVQLAATQVAHIGNLTSSAAGTLTSTLTGDALVLRYQLSTNDWWATSVIGTWLVA